jgi:hypothetical protein
LIPQIPDGFYIRSLLSGKSLEEYLGVAIDAKVLHSLRVRSRGVCPALNGGSISKGRSRVPAKGLHGGRVEEEEGEKDDMQRRERRLHRGTGKTGLRSLGIEVEENEQGQKASSDTRFEARIWPFVRDAGQSFNPRDLSRAVGKPLLRHDFSSCIHTNHSPIQHQITVYVAVSLAVFQTRLHVCHFTIPFASYAW